MTKLIIFALLLAISVGLCACSDANDNASDASDGSAEESFELPDFSEEELPADDIEFTREKAIALIGSDRLVTEIFVNNSLYKGGNKTAEYYGLPVESEYVNFKAVTSLLNNTYTKGGGCIDAFLSYPQGLPPAVTQKNGRTYVFRHPTEQYLDFIRPDTVKVTDTELETEKYITAETNTSKRVVLKAVLEDGRWRLEKGIFSVNPFEEVKNEEKLLYSDIGSFKSLSGSLLVIEFFISDRSSEFISEEEEEYHGRISTAISYLADTAEKYGKTLEPTYKRAYFKHDGVLGIRSLDFDIMFADTGFGTLEAFAEQNYDLTQYDNYVFVVCLDKEADVTNELYKNTDQTRIYSGERVIIGQKSEIADICASMLKLVGAYGYDDGLCDEYTEALYHAYYKDDILISKSLVNSSISPVTAFACGLTDSLDRYNSIFYYGK
ncbi:MAG: hypothetical protein IKY21_01465 [Clostridia bacterium]|nr:hypothetical protein [Clostridia bacterium]